MKNLVWLACISSGIFGCGSSINKATNLEKALEVAERSMPSDMAVQGAQGENAAKGVNGDSTLPQRKIIYTGQISLVVEDFAKTELQVVELVNRFDGYVAESNVDHTQGSRRTGKWVVRIPVAKFDEFLDAVTKFGVPETRHTNAQDVTQDYVDLEARMSSKKEIERRIIKLLEDRSGDIKDVIAVESELGRVREEIERMEGRLRYLSNMTLLTTVTISVREQQNYVPPQAPTFTAQIGQTWSTSIRSMKETAQQVVLVAIAVIPWLLLLALLLAPLAWIVRRITKRPVKRDGLSSKPPVVYGQ